MQEINISKGGQSNVTVTKRAKTIECDRLHFPKINTAVSPDI